ncbi:4583_t:CDS:2 [Ambispora leptoticha]|uniref:4583_t:CDS:1 n=1 Tax=Ambispora leptoticha TaxID=144679 RepID=A0A9N8W4I4_9GLOM|nr:4583_t:CDS:2 [Ambispora leptoticha]
MCMEVKRVPRIVSVYTKVDDSKKDDDGKTIIDEKNERIIYKIEGPIKKSETYLLRKRTNTKNNTPALSNPAKISRHDDDLDESLADLDKALELN